VSDRERMSRAGGEADRMEGEGVSTDVTEQRATRSATLAFVVTFGCAVALAVVYARGGNPRAEGALLLVGLVALGWGLVIVGHHLLGGGERVEERHVLIDAEEEASVDEALERGAALSRRRLLFASLVGAVGALAAAAVFPIRSLGPSPGRSLDVTPWRRGRRAVTSDGRRVRADEVPTDGIVTIFPEGSPDSADGQAVLLRVDPALLDLPPGRDNWTPRGLIAYSKVCTHAGCPVGLYEVEPRQLLCPCHQSAFAVLQGAKPVAGPAARALPQLPLRIDDDGFVVATGDFSSPVGPAWWSRP
jgi:quinol---cytochrome c reductase iron-sulfur subunit